MSRSITVRMTVGTAVLLVVVLGITYSWHQRDLMARRQAELRVDAELTSKLVMRSFEAVEPGKSPVHADYLARNLVELQDIHDIVVVAADGTVAFSHHADQIGQRFDPASAPGCSGCHTAKGVRSDSREYAARDGRPIFHEGFAIPNEPACQRCHEPRQAVLGMLLMSLELSPFYADLARQRSSLASSVAAAAMASLLFVWALFRILVRRPLGRLERDIRRLEGGDFRHLHGPRGEHEIADVHASFIAMAGRLREASEALEKRVRDGAARIDSLSCELDLVYSNLMHLEHLSAMGTLSAKIAHEIRTPLNAMALNLQLLERGLGRGDGGGPGMVELLGDVSRELQRIVEILNHFMARVRRPALEPEPESVGPVVESVAFLMAAEARRAGVAVETQVEPALRSLPAHATHLRQILTNLVSNAIKATPRGGRVRVRAYLGTDRVKIVVEDTGPGVPAQLQHRILEPFFTTRPDGTGLGLAIVAHIVCECGGELAVGDAPELGGAAFTVTLGECARAPAVDAAPMEASS